MKGVGCEDLPHNAPLTTLPKIAQEITRSSCSRYKPPPVNRAPSAGHLQGRGTPRSGQQRGASPPSQGRTPPQPRSRVPPPAPPPPAPLPLGVAAVEEDEVPALHALGAGETAAGGVAKRAALHRHVQPLGVLLGASQNPGPGTDAAPALPAGLRPAAAGRRHDGLGAPPVTWDCCRPGALWGAALRRRGGLRGTARLTGSGKTSVGAVESGLSAVPAQTRAPVKQITGSQHHGVGVRRDLYKPSCPTALQFCTGTPTAPSELRAHSLTSAACRDIAASLGTPCLTALTLNSFPLIASLSAPTLPFQSETVSNWKRTTAPVFKTSYHSKHEVISSSEKTQSPFLISELFPHFLKEH